ncbi:MAG: FHA domain-containing protein [Eubacterium sp.]
MKKINAKLKTSKGEVIQLEDWSFRIGAFEGVCNYVLKDEMASPVHGVIEYKGDKWYIQDTNSAAGINVNGQKIVANKPVLLSQNDTITIAETVFTFIMDLELFKNTDIRLINDLYKNWLLECDVSMQKRYRQEIFHLIGEKLNTLGENFILSEKQNEVMINISTDETEVLSGDGDMPTSVLIDIDGDNVTTVLNEETNDGATLSLSEEGNGATTVLTEEGNDITTVLTEEGNDATTVLSEEDEDATVVLNEEEDKDAKVVLNEESHCILERVNSKDGEIDIDTLPFIIGKAMSQVNYCLNEACISRRQARIFRGEKNAFFIADLDSRNGTFVNGKKVLKDSAVEINDGDMISFAEYNFIVSIK